MLAGPRYGQGRRGRCATRGRRGVLGDGMGGPECLHLRCACLRFNRRNCPVREGLLTNVQDALPVLIDRSPVRLIARDAGGEAALDAAWDRIRRYESSDNSDLDSSLGDDDDGYSPLDDSYSDDLLDGSQDASGLGSSQGDDSGSFALGSLPDTDRLTCAFDLWRLGLDSDRPSGMRLEEVAHVLAEEPTSSCTDGSSSPSESSITFGSLPDTDGLSCPSGLWRLALGGGGGE
ncbi:uncharacterized protein SCHCODRAFT_02044012 [Schizophyllum commune H4-8]|uniref:uncharacterized protein n=1 Tax=Schizophyllum commune (strain H4-8 / FGSC 9210) TaxID=578458 RepID=UPI002160448B|nr:uncharacterized protein SCHCODRAFT_02044012 [Schizophyllum commune H4-8]KAI5900796.1 hypothetical protein SCHCODRAFT_02044012 [Schizophyllum commune H4-8]